MVGTPNRGGRRGWISRFRANAQWALQIKHLAKDESVPPGAM